MNLGWLLVKETLCWIFRCANAYLEEGLSYGLPVYRQIRYAISKTHFPCSCIRNKAKMMRNYDLVQHLMEIENEVMLDVRRI